VVIAIGLRSTIRMNLYERMREFGTLRAIGYSRRQSYSIIFFEAFFLSLLSLAGAFVIAAILEMILGTKGIYLGPGPLSYFGGEYLYPQIQVADVILAIIVMVLFTLISTLSPGLQLCFQNITDIMAKRQKRVKILKAMFARKRKSRRGKKGTATIPAN
jgi:putative ABC transport system permease protein